MKPGRDENAIENCIEPKYISKLFESILKDFIIEDISKNIDVGQFGGQSGMGTDHMLVSFLDRILYLLDRNPDKSAVLAMCFDWASAFDRQDPTLAIQKFIQMGVRPSLVPLLASYLTDRKMTVKLKNEMSKTYPLVGGGPQGTLLGGIEYLVLSNDNADCVKPEDRFKYIDDLSLLEFVCLTGLLTEYNFLEHVPSDIAVDEKFLPVESISAQKTLDAIDNWSTEHLMQLNVKKCNYMVFSRSSEKFATRLQIGDKMIERVTVTKLQAGIAFGSQHRLSFS